MSMKYYKQALSVLSVSLYQTHSGCSPINVEHQPRPIFTTGLNIIIYKASLKRFCYIGNRQMHRIRRDHQGQNSLNYKHVNQTRNTPKQ